MYIKNLNKALHAKTYKQASNTQQPHMQLHKRILRHIKGISNTSLCYVGLNFTLKRYVDLNYTGDLDKRIYYWSCVYICMKYYWVLKLQTVATFATGNKKSFVTFTVVTLTIDCHVLDFYCCDSCLNMLN